MYGKSGMPFSTQVALQPKRMEP